MKNIIVAGVYHETNTFSPTLTEVEAFQRRWYLADHIIDHFAGTRTVIGGFIDGAKQQNFNLIPTFATFATPSGTVSEAAFSQIQETLKAQLYHVSEQHIDGVLLELHGDFVAQACDDAEERIVAIIKEIFPSLPIAAVLDYHTNASRPRLNDVEVVIGYKENPHIDTYERGIEAVQLLRATLDGALTPYRAQRGMRFTVPPIVQQTSEQPMKTIMDAAAKLEQDSRIMNVTIHGSYCYADREYTGMGISVTADVKDKEFVEASADVLLETYLKVAEQFNIELKSAAEALAEAASSSQYPVVIADTGDNINGGSSGDTTWLLHETKHFPTLKFLTTIADSEALANLQQCQEGQTVTVRLGGKLSQNSGLPFETTAVIKKISDGVFTNTGPMAHGAEASMHGAVWLQLEQGDVVVQGAAVQPNDTNLFESLGIDLRDYQVFMLKGAVAVRAAWSRLTSTFITASTPGDTDMDLKRLSFTHFVSDM